MPNTETTAAAVAFTPAATTHYKGIAPLTIVRIGNPPTAIASVYEDQIVPAGADPEDVARLIDEGYLVEVELVADTAALGLTPEQAAEYADYVQAQHERIAELEGDLAAARAAAGDPDEVTTLRKQVEDLTAQLTDATAPPPTPPGKPAASGAAKPTGKGSS